MIQVKPSRGTRMMVVFNSCLRNMWIIELFTLVLLWLCYVPLLGCINCPVQYKNYHHIETYIDKYNYINSVHISQAIKSHSIRKSQHGTCCTHFPTSMYFCLFSSFLDDTLPHWDLASDTKLMVSRTTFTYKACKKFVSKCIKQS